MADGDVTTSPRRAVLGGALGSAVRPAREREAADASLTAHREQAGGAAAASAARVGRVNGQRLLLVAWALLMILALGVGWVSARGSFGLRALVCLGLGATGLYLYLRLRERR